MSPKKKDLFDTFLDWLEALIKRWLSLLTSYIRKLLFPLYLFPVKLITYSLYYLIKFFFVLIFAILGIIKDSVVFPFSNLKNFLKSIIYLAIGLYLLASFFVIGDYLRTQYGFYGKFLCSIGTKDHLRDSVVRIVGGYSEGSGFFINQNQILTNFHVIADEPSPKVILPDGKFFTPIKIVGNKDVDLAVLTTDRNYKSLVLSLPQKEVEIFPDEPLIATGYPLGTALSGQTTSSKGNFIAFRQSKKDPVVFIQTNVSLVKGMSGGPLTDQCGNVVGINTMTLAGLSLFISGYQAQTMIPSFTDQNITKIDVDPSKSPEDAVKAFYTYLKARRMEDGFKLLSQDYLKKTNFEEWTGRFADILDVDTIKSEKYEDTEDTAFVKFSTKNWVDNEADVHYYEGTWQTILENGMYKMYKSNIIEVEEPGWDWFYN